MSTPVTTSTDACPDCDAPLTTDPRFTTWCPGCEWNLLPPPRPVDHSNARKRRRAEKAARQKAARERSVRARAEKVYGLVDAGARPSRDGSWLAAVALAGAVHLLTLTLLVGGILLVAAGWTWPLRITGVIALGLVAMLRPRLGRWKRRDSGLLTRTEAPALYALADRVAAEVGTRPVDQIRLTGAFNASFGRAGLLRRSRLTLGQPLWVGLTPQQRVALLGHEFGHDVNGDHRRGLWLRSAIDALSEWCRMTNPNIVAGNNGARGNGLAVIAMLVAASVMKAVNLCFERLLLLLDRLTTRSGQSAEYRADGLAARAASTEAARGMLELLLLPATAEAVVNRRRSTPRSGRGRSGARNAPQQDLWTELAEQLASVPPIERERRLRLSERDCGTVDSTHPPTHLRIRLLDRRPATAQAAVTVTETETAAIEAELAPHRERIARDLTGH